MLQHDNHFGEEDKKTISAQQKAHSGETQQNNQQACYLPAAPAFFNSLTHFNLQPPDLIMIAVSKTYTLLPYNNPED